MKLYRWTILLITAAWACFISPFAEGQAAEPMLPRIRDAFAWVNRQNAPYKPFYNDYVAPHAILHGDAIYVAYQDGEGRPIVMSYDLAGKGWSGPVRASDFGLGSDSHGNPSLNIDAAGHLHLLFGCHGNPIKHLRSVQPYDINKWESASSPAKSATYTQLYRMADGSLHLYYRAGRHLAPWVERTSQDNGISWSAARPLVEMRNGANQPRAGSYHTFLPGAENKTIHCFWLHKDDNPRRNKRNYPGMDEAVYRYNFYYAKRTEQGKWIGADGTEFTDGPVNKPWCDRHAKVLDSGDEFVTFKRAVVDEHDVPYLYFEQGVEDWAAKLNDIANGIRKDPQTYVKVPIKQGFLSQRLGKWERYNTIPADWSAAVQKRLFARGPAVVGQKPLVPWFIYYSLSSEEDPTKAYLWLEEIDGGLASRKDGPAPPPEDQVR